MGSPNQRSKSFSTDFEYPVWARFRYQAKLRIKRLPYAQSGIKKVWQLIGAFLFLSKRQLTTIFRTINGTYIKDIDPDKLCWISPEKIIHVPNREFPHHVYKGFIAEGDWDVITTKFEDLDVFVAFRQVFNGEKQWNETVFYQRVLDLMNDGFVPWGCRNPEEFDNRCKSLEDLFDVIKNDGYKAQQEILPTKGILNRLKIEDEISVSIGREGDLLFGDGAHRLTIAKLLEIEKIPIRFSARHVEWVSFRKTLQIYASHYPHGILPHPLSHPDLEDIPSSFEDDSVFTLIKKNISITDGCLINIGANLGYFCSKFEDAGFESYAIETLLESEKLLKKLKRIDNKQFKIINWNTFKSKNNLIKQHLSGANLNLIEQHHKKDKFDFAIVHIHDQRQLANTNIRQLIDCLNNIKVPELFLCVSVSINQFYGNVDGIPNLERLLNIISTNANLSRIEQLDTLAENILFKLS